jgi:putative FmdB family regulatory protein
MPIYEYRCTDCEQIFEEWQTDYKERELICPVCGSKARRLISNTSFVLKGSGWYTTDYCRSSSSNGKGPSSTSNGPKAGGDASTPASGGGAESTATGTSGTTSGS